MQALRHCPSNACIRSCRTAPPSLLCPNSQDRLRDHSSASRPQRVPASADLPKVRVSSQDEGPQSAFFQSHQDRSKTLGPVSEQPSTGISPWIQSRASHGFNPDYTSSTAERNHTSYAMEQEFPPACEACARGQSERIDDDFEWLTTPGCWGTRQCFQLGMSSE